MSQQQKKIKNKTENIKEPVVIDKSTIKKEKIEQVSNSESEIEQELKTEELDLFPGFENVENMALEETNLEIIKESDVSKGKPETIDVKPDKITKKEEPLIKNVNHRETAVKEPSDFFKTHTKKELSDYGKTKLKEIAYSESMEEALFPLICQDLFGFKGSFVGDKGGLKGEFLDSLAILLYEIGKISKPSYITVNFSEIPDKFELDKLYVIEDLSDAVVNLFNMDESSESSSITQLNYKNRLESLIKSPGAAYIVLNAIDTDLRGFLTLDARLPFLFGRKVVFQNLSNEAIVDRFIDALPELHQNLVTKEFKNEAIGYLERNRRYFPFDNQELANYLANYTSRFEELKFPQEKYNAKTLEESIMSRMDQIDYLISSNQKNESDIKTIYQKMKNTFQKVGLVKYDAFQEMGGKLSFSLALLNEANDGFIINAMHSREGCYTYIKEIIDGNSIIALAEEEKEALDMAMSYYSKEQI